MSDTLIVPVTYLLLDHMCHRMAHVSSVHLSIKQNIYWLMKCATLLTV